jgi:hypothetical protein
MGPIGQIVFALLLMLVVFIGLVDVLIAAFG